MMPITVNADDTNKINQAKAQISEFLGIKEGARLRFHDDSIEVQKNKVTITVTYVNGLNQKSTDTWSISID